MKILPGDIAVWNPTTERWARGPRGPLGADYAPAVWDGTQMFAVSRGGRLLAYNAGSG